MVASACCYGARTHTRVVGEAAICNARVGRVEADLHPILLHFWLRVVVNMIVRIAIVDKLRAGVAQQPLRVVIHYEIIGAVHRWVPELGALFPHSSPFVNLVVCPHAPGV